MNWCTLLVVCRYLFGMFPKLTCVLWSRWEGSKLPYKHHKRDFKWGPRSSLALGNLRSFVMLRNPLVLWLKCMVKVIYGSNTPYILHFHICFRVCPCQPLSTLSSTSYWIIMENCQNMENCHEVLWCSWVICGRFERISFSYNFWHFRILLCYWVRNTLRFQFLVIKFHKALYCLQRQQDAS